MRGGTVERPFTDRRCSNGFGRITQNGKSSTCVVACVDVRPSLSSVSNGNGANGHANGNGANGHGSHRLDLEAVRQIALQRLERCLRPDDRVCAIGGGRLLVYFGHGASHAPVGALGARLAAALGRPLSIDSHQQDLDVVVGIGTGAESGVSQVVGAALSASSALSNRLRSAPGAADSSRTQVVLAKLPVRGGHKRLQRREVLPAAMGHANGTYRPAGSPSSVGGSDQAWDSELDVLLVSLDAVSPPRTNPAVDGLLACVRRVGVAPQVAAGPDPEGVIESYKRSTPEVVILALHGEGLAANGAGATGTVWEQWARLTRELVRLGATVLAVPIGVSVAAVATCVREGAIGIVDAGELLPQLEKLNANLSSRRLASENGSKDVGRSSVQGTLPSPYHRLTYLTTSEHRVLFHMMQGASAQEIAEDLIVSLATVRSHIRSILRKLRVRSQLAAVALANGAQPKMVDAD